MKYLITVVALCCLRKLALFKFTSIFFHIVLIRAKLFPWCLSKSMEDTFVCVDVLDYHYSTHIVSSFSQTETLTICYIFSDTLLECWPLQVVHSSSSCWWLWIASVTLKRKQNESYGEIFPFHWGWQHQGTKEKLVKTSLEQLVLISLYLSSIACCLPPPITFRCYNHIYSH